MRTRNNYLAKVAFAISLALVLTFLMIRTSKADNSKDDPYRVETFTLEGEGMLNVETTGGYITVEGSSGNTVRVEMYVRKDGRELSREDTDLEDWTIDINQSGNEVNVHAERNSSFWDTISGNDISVSFVVYTPKGMNGNLNTSGGHINIRQLNGDQNLSTSGGHIEMANIKGTVDARTSGGHIEIESIEGDVNARTSGGHISAEDVAGNLKVETSGGHIELEDISGEIEATTSGGSIEADLATVGPYVDFRTSGGNVNITVPEDMGFDLDLEGNYVSADLSNFSGQSERDEVNGTINGGGPAISARTSGGIVSLSFQ